MKLFTPRTVASLVATWAFASATETNDGKPPALQPSFAAYPPAPTPATPNKVGTTAVITTVAGVDFVPIEGMVSILGVQDHLTTDEMATVQDCVATAFHAVMKEGTGVELLGALPLPPSTVPIESFKTGAGAEIDAADLELWRWPWRPRPPPPTKTPTNKPFFRRPPRGPYNLWECWMCPDDDVYQLKGSAAANVAFANVGGTAAGGGAPPMAIFSSTFYVGTATSSDNKPVDMNAMVALLSSDEVRYNKFQHQMCNNLRTSGMDALSTAHHCKFSILQPPQAPAIVEQDAKLQSLCVDGKKRGQAVVILTNADPSEITKDDADLLNTAVTQAYNAAYADAGWVLDSFSAKTAAAPETDDDSSIIVGEFTQVCTQDSAEYTANSTALAAVATPTPDELARMHANFERTLCSQLRADETSSLRYVGQCTYRTFNNPTIGKGKKTHKKVSPIEAIA